jgi:hypothetical protein
MEKILEAMRICWENEKTWKNIGQNLDMLVWNKHVFNGRYSTWRVFRVSNGTSNLRVSVLTILTHSHVNPMV